MFLNHKSNWAKNCTQMLGDIYTKYMFSFSISSVVFFLQIELKYFQAFIINLNQKMLEFVTSDNSVALCTKVFWISSTTNRKLYFHRFIIPKMAGIDYSNWDLLQYQPHKGINVSE